MMDLYRARWRRFRAAPGTPEWHRATADIREHAGRYLEALAHRLTAALVEALEPLVEAVAGVVPGAAGPGGGEK